MNPSPEYEGQRIYFIFDVVHIIKLLRSHFIDQGFMLESGEFFGRNEFEKLFTGYSLSEALILASINPKYDRRLIVELQVQYMLCTSNCFFLHL
jgi:hypothetical protein